MSKIKKIACYGDIHFGKKNSSEIHNQDCLDFISFFCEQVKKDPDITHISFLGDLFENRAAVNISTLNYAHEGLRMIDALGLPVLHLVGNHDLYHRTNRKIHSAKVFQELKNFEIISEPTVVDNILFCPYMFPEEYPSLMQYKDIPVWVGHFEFKKFVVTGSTLTLDKGNDHTLFKNQDFIFSGHFHRRQFRDNVVFIGNTFPMDYGDAGDSQRGMMVFDNEAKTPDFIDWPDCPLYVKTTLSRVLDGDINFLPKTRVKCLLDVDITYSETQTLRSAMVDTYQLREFQIEENLVERADAVDGETIDVSTLQLSNIDDMVKSMLKSGIKDMTKIKPETLIEIYDSL